MSRQPKAATRAKRAVNTGPRLSRTRQPEDASAEVWQIGLRRQFGGEQAFGLEPLGTEPVFSEFIASNPESGGRYRVAIRGSKPGDNFCACADFATNDLGTCKHIEFTLARLATRRGGKAASARGFEAPWSELFLRYAAPRCLVFRAGTECPPAQARQAGALIDAQTTRMPDLDTLLQSAAKLGHELRRYDDARSFVAEQRDAARRHQVFDAA